MRIQRLTVVAMLIAVMLAPSLAAADVQVGKPAPDFTAADTAGKAVTLSKLKGKYVVLEWTNSGCPFVHKHYDSGNMQLLQKKYTNKGVVWLSIISSALGREGYVSDAQANQLTADRHASPSAVIRDTTGAIGHAYGAKTTPHMFVIDKDGTLVYAGAIDSIASVDQADIKTAHNYIDLTFADLDAGRPVTTPLTVSYGCSVKY